MSRPTTSQRSRPWAKAAALITVTRAEALVLPGYDDAGTEAEVGTQWHQRYLGLVGTSGDNRSVGLERGTGGRWRTSSVSMQLMTASGTSRCCSGCVGRPYGDDWELVIPVTVEGGAQTVSLAVQFDAFFGGAAT